MINLRWIEDGELKSLELHHNLAVNREVERIQGLKRAAGQPTAFLEHPVTDALFPIYGSLYQIKIWTGFSESDEVVSLMKLARIIDSRDETQRASAYISHRLTTADYEARIAQLELQLRDARAKSLEDIPQKAE